MNQYRHHSRRRPYHHKKSNGNFFPSHAQNYNPHPAHLKYPDDYDSCPASIPSPSLIVRSFNRCRLVLGSLLLLPAALVLSPKDLFFLGDFCDHFRNGTLP